MGGKMNDEIDLEIDVLQSKIQGLEMENYEIKQEINSQNSYHENLKMTTLNLHCFFTGLTELTNDQLDLLANIFLDCKTNFHENSEFVLDCRKNKDLQLMKVLETKSLPNLNTILMINVDNNQGAVIDFISGLKINALKSLILNSQQVINIAPYMEAIKKFTKTRKLEEVTISKFKIGTFQFAKFMVYFQTATKIGLKSCLLEIDETGTNFSSSLGSAAFNILDLSNSGHSNYSEFATNQARLTNIIAELGTSPQVRSALNKLILKNCGGIKQTAQTLLANNNLSN
jgi:hypothetical protein